MAKPITIPNTFASATSAIPLSQLDQDFSTLANATNDLATYSNYVADTGAADAYIANFPANTNTASLTAGLTVQFKAANANTGASTLNVQVNGSTIGTAAIRYANGSSLAAGAIAAGALVSVMYDGTNFQLINDPAGQSGGDVTGPASATDNAIARFDGASGKLIQNSVVTIADTTGDMSGVGTLSAGNVTVSGTANAATLIVTGNSTLGDASGDTLTITGTTVTTPNGLIFDSNTLVIDATNDRVGIGTSSPAQKLDVNGTANFGNINTGNGISTGGASIELGGLRTGDGVSLIDFHSVSGTDYESRILRVGGVNGALQIINTGTGDFRLAATGAAPMIFDTSSLERMRITSSGNVGIGTTSPARPLDVNGSLRISDSAVIEWGGTSANIAGSSSSNDLFFRTASTERMRITSAGNVGIGTSSPTGILSGDNVVVDASGTNGAEFITRRSGGAINLVMGVASNNVGYLASTTATPITLWTSNTERMRIDSAGNVGIGTSSPATALHVFRSGSTTVASRLANDSVSMQTYVDGSFCVTGTITGTPYIIATSNTERMRLNTSGTVILQGGNTGATGVGIAFPATQSASSDANTLDDYEEGTWTPSLSAITTAPTGVTYDATYRKGRYVKIGRMVFVEYIMILTNKGTGGVGDSLITGLPFTHSANDVFATYTGTVCNLTTGRNGVFMQMNSGQNYLVALYGNGGTAVGLPWSDLANNSDFRGMLCYEV